jgi:four helix bundle protein
MQSRSPAKTFQDLVVWQKAHQFVLKIYKFTAGFPPREAYGLVAQFRRAAVSIPANIAEGFARNSQPDKVRFLIISKSSLEECRYFLILSNDLGYGDTSLLYTQLEEVSKLLSAYIQKLAPPLKNN